MCCPPLGCPWSPGFSCPKQCYTRVPSVNLVLPICSFREWRWQMLQGPFPSAGQSAGQRSPDRVGTQIACRDAQALGACKSLTGWDPSDFSLGLCLRSLHCLLDRAGVREPRWQSDSPVAYLYTNDKQSEKETGEKTPFPIATNNIKYLREI